MKTNTYLGLISLQLGATNIQHSQLAARQAERDAEQRQLTREANEVAQKAYYAQWRQTPEGQHFERWREAALDITALVRDRNDAWTAIREAILSIEIANVPEPSATDTDLRKPKRVYSVVATALWVIAFILIGASPDPDSPMEQVGGFLAPARSQQPCS